MIDKELKKEVEEKLVELLKPMTSEERGKYLAEITQLTLHMSMLDNLPESMKQALRKNEEKVN